MSKLLACLFCLLCAAGCAQTGPNSYGMDVYSLDKWSQLKFQFRKDWEEWSMKAVPAREQLDAENHSPPKIAAATLRSLRFLARLTAFL